MTNDCDLSWYLYICISGLYDEWSGLCEQWLVAGRVVVVATVSVKFLQSWREVRSDREISWPLYTGTLALCSVTTINKQDWLGSVS